MPALPPDQETSHADAGDGVEVTVDQARGGQRSGRIIWVLVIGLVLVAAAMFATFALRPNHAVSTEERSGVNRTEANSFQAPQPSPKQAPADMPSTTGQTTPDASSNAGGR